MKQFKEIFQGYLSTRFTDNEWDEQIVNKIKIKKVHLVFSDAWYRQSDSGDPDEDDYKGYEDFSIFLGFSSNNVDVIYVRYLVIFLLNISCFSAIIRTNIGHILVIVGILLKEL